jgi:hypothetical protein
MPLVDLPADAQLDPPGDLPPGAQLDAGIIANVGAGANDMVASAAGAPVDAMTWFVNKLREHVAGNPQPWITSPVGGSDSIRSAMGLIGADPRNIGANTAGAKVAREVGAAIPATVTPYLGARAAIERGATGLLPRMLGGAGGPGQSGGQTLAGALTSGVVGAGGALGGQAAEGIVGGESPTANLVGQIAGGALTGGALSGAARTAARALSPNVSPDVRLLMDAGVTPTPGQILGGRAGRTEEAVTSIPWVGDVVKSARARANEQFNRGAINRALAPIGEKLNPATALGREAIDEAASKVSANYDALVPQLAATADSKFATDLGRIMQMSRFMPPERTKQFRNVVDAQVSGRLSPNGTMTGESFKEAESEIGRLAAQYRHSPIGDERQLGGALQELRDTMRDWLTRSNPARADDLAKANTAYANLLRVQGAAARPGVDPGVFTPAQLQATVRQLDPTLRKGSFARGRALMQDYADAGRAVLGSRVPDSGTPYRTLTALLAGTGGGMAIEPTTAVTAGIAGLGASGMYTPRGQAAMAKILTQRPDWAASLADILRQTAPPAGAAMSYPVLGSLAP